MHTDGNATTPKLRRKRPDYIRRSGYIAPDAGHSAPPPSLERSWHGRSRSFAQELPTPQERHHETSDLDRRRSRSRREHHPLGQRDACERPTTIQHPAHPVDGVAVDGANHPGDHYEFYDRDTGDTRGKDYFDCVVTNPHGDTICNAEFVLKDGNISIEGVFNANATKVDTSAVITGGTGRYNAASGTAIATGSPTSTNFAFHFAR